MHFGCRQREWLHRRHGQRHHPEDHERRGGDNPGRDTRGGRLRWRERGDRRQGIAGRDGSRARGRADAGPVLRHGGARAALAERHEFAGWIVPGEHGWSTHSDAAAIVSGASSFGAFALPSGSADCALLLTLRPCTYTAVVPGAGSMTGIALAGAYRVPPVCRITLGLTVPSAGGNIPARRDAVVV